MSWRVAKSLLTLRAQYNAAHPSRSTAYDGTVGDLRHQRQSGGSDHNPGPDGIVQAIDLTAQGKTGLALAAAALATLKARGQGGYVIHQGRIANPSVQGGAWRTYRGANPHNHHVHVSVHSQLDTTKAWHLGAKGVAGVAKPVSAAVVRPKRLVVDGAWGPATQMALAHAAGLKTLTSQAALWRAVQRWAGLTGADVDGVLGPRTSAAIAAKIGDSRHPAWSSKLVRSLQEWLNDHGATR